MHLYLSALTQSNLSLPLVLMNLKGACTSHRHGNCTLSLIIELDWMLFPHLNNLVQVSPHERGSDWSLWQPSAFHFLRGTRTAALYFSGEIPPRRIHFDGPCPTSLYHKHGKEMTHCLFHASQRAWQMFFSMWNLKVTRQRSAANSNWHSMYIRAIFVPLKLSRCTFSQHAQ